MVSKWIVILAVVIGLSWLCMLGFAQEESDMDCGKLVMKKAYDKALIDFKKGKTIECDCEHCKKAGVKAKAGKLKIIGEGDGNVIRIKEGKVVGHPEIIRKRDGKIKGGPQIIHTHDGKIEGHPEIIHTHDGRMILRSHGNGPHACTEEIGMLELEECDELGALMICGSEGECIDLLDCEECEECEEYEIMLRTGDGSHDLRRIIRSKGEKGDGAILLSTIIEDEDGRRIVERHPRQARPARRAVTAARPLASAHPIERAPSRLAEKYSPGNEEKVEALSDEINDLRAEVQDLHKIVKKLQKHIERMAH